VKSTGWANNGMQIDQGARATVARNLIQGHWWNLDNFVSTGLMVMSNGVTAQYNTLRDNDLGLYLIGNKHNAHHNTIEITHAEISIDDIYGAFIFGDNNAVSQSGITSSVATGLGLGVMGKSNKLIRNTVTGWGTNFWDGGEGTKIPKPFAIPN
jgi:hypothetical protein